MARRFGEGTESSEVAHGIVAEHKAANEAMRMKIERIIGIVVLVAAVVLFGYSVFVKVTAPAKLEELDADIVDIKATLKEKRDFNENGGNIVYTDPIMSSAKDMGELVCDYQNRLINYDNEWCAKQPSTSAPGSFDIPMSVDHQRCLEGFQNDCLYRDPRNNDLAQAVKGNAMIWSYYGQWEFKADYDYEGTTVNLVFLCFDTMDTHTPKRDLLAMAICEYDRTEDAIMSISLTKTPLYDAKYARDYRRNSSLATGWHPGQSTIQPDQDGDPSIGPPNDPNAVDNDTTQPSGTSGGEVSQWGTPSGNSGGSLVLGGN